MNGKHVVDCTQNHGLNLDQLIRDELMIGLGPEPLGESGR
jgi:hypothetical protein